MLRNYNNEILKYNNKTIIPEEEKIKIINNYNDYTKNKKNYYNGNIYGIINCFNNKFEIVKTDYASLIYSPKSKCYELSSIFVGIYFKTLDNKIIIVKNNHDSLSLFGGMANREDFENDIFKHEKCIVRELKEEANINLYDKNMVKDFKPVYLKLPEKNEKVYLTGIIYEGFLNQTFEDFKDYFYNNINKTDKEVSDILDITKEKIKYVKTYDKKEPYIVELLEKITKNLS